MEDINVHLARRYKRKVINIIMKAKRLGKSDKQAFAMLPKDHYLTYADLEILMDEVKI